MDHEPDCGTVGTGSDLESGLCPLSLTGYGFPGEVGRSTPWLWKTVVSCNITTQCAYPEIAFGV